MLPMILGGGLVADLGADPSLANVELLMQVRGTDAAPADLIDRGPRNLGAPTVVSSGGYPQIVTVDKTLFHAGKGLELDGTVGTGLKWPASSGIVQPGAGDYTAEILLAGTGAAGDAHWTGNGSYSNAEPGDRWAANFDNGTVADLFGYLASQVLTHDSAMNDHPNRRGLTHLAWTRSGATSYFHVNGALLGSGVAITSGYSDLGNSDGINVGNAGLTGDTDVNTPLTAIVFAYRYTRALARYGAADFHPPMMGFPEQ